jgi:hypothetical protein
VFISFFTKFNITIADSEVESRRNWNFPLGETPIDGGTRGREKSFAQNANGLMLF